MLGSAVLRPRAFIAGCRKRKKIRSALHGDGGRGRDPWVGCAGYKAKSKECMTRYAHGNTLGVDGS
jgi:hypothetical protein